MDKYCLIALCFVLCGCAAKKVAPAVDKTDSVVIVREKVVHVHDTIPFEIPAQEAVNVTIEDSSFLSNDFCWSSAKVDSSGVLSHRLETFRRSLRVPVVRDSIVRDSIVYRDRVKNVPYPIERKLSWWERVKIDSYVLLVIVIVLENVWLWLRRRRR